MKYLRERARLMALVVLAAVTAYGLYELFSGDWRGALSYWRGKQGVLLVAVAMQACDISLDCALWLWILRDFHIRPRRWRGPLIFLAGYAGLLLPLQLGRFLRSEELVRTGGGTIGEAVKSELTLLFLSAVAAVAVLAAVIAWLLHPLLAPVAVVTVIAVFLLTADWTFQFLSETPVNMPRHYWRRRKTFAIAGLAMVGWVLNGTSLYLVTRGLPGNFGYLQAVFTAPSNMLLGTATGLPGGIGAVEGFLGVSLRWGEIPSEHLLLAVNAFRVVTFWLWIPVVWLAFTAAGRIPTAEGAAHEGEPLENGE